MPRIILCVVLILFLGVRQTVAQRLFVPSADSVHTNIVLPLLPQNFYNQHLGFFCQQELRVQKAIKLPLYFRLGSKNYVDYLERKPNAVKVRLKLPY